MSEEQPRNAQAGQRQREHEKKQRQAAGNAFSKYDLTRKNEEFMYQLSKQLDREGVTGDKKSAMIQETITKLLAGQKKGQTARALLGTPTAYAKELKNPKPTSQEVTKRSIALLSIDNGLIFLSIFTFMFGLMFWMSPQAMQSSRAGSSGITAILLVAVLGGLLFGYVALQLQPKSTKDGKVNRKPLWVRIVTIALGLVAWLGVYMLASLLPNAVNPRLNQWAYIIIALVAFGGDLYFRRRYHINGSIYGSQRRN